MKFIHLADLHIGKILNQKNLLIDQTYILNQIIKIIKDEQVDKVIISGDIYDRQIPSGEAVEVFNDFLNHLINDLKVKVYMITGNHDSKERLNFASSILDKRGLFIKSFIKMPLEVVKEEDEYGDLFIYFMPYAPLVEVKTKYNLTCQTLDEMVKVLLDNSNIDYTKRNILLTHHTLNNINIIKSQSEATIVIGGTEGFDVDLIKDFDYVALGHLHTPQHVVYDHVRYSGSILKYSESEANTKKAVCVIDIKEKGQIEIKQHILNPLHDLRQLKGNFKDILKDDKNEDYVYVTLTDQTIYPNAMKKIRAVYPNCVALKYEKIEEKKIEEVESINTDDYSTIDKLNMFYEKVLERPMNDDEIEYLKKYIKDM